MALTCPACGARNPEQAVWCGQCFGDLHSAEVAVAEGEQGGSSFEVMTASEAPAPAWVCRNCGTGNPIEESTCQACGFSIFQTFGAGLGGRQVDPQRALIGGLLLPGRGQALAGQGLLGTLIAMTVMFGLVFGLVIWSGGNPLFGSLLVAAGLATHTVAAMDGYRLARGLNPFMRARVVSVVFGVLFTGLLAAAWRAQSAVAP